MNVRKKQIIFWSVAGIVLAASLLYFFSILQNYQKAEAEWKRLDRQSQEVERGLEPGKTIETSMQKLDEQLVSLQARFPTREEESLGKLSDLAGEIPVSIVTIKTQPKSEFFNVDQKQLQSNGKSLRQVPVTVELRGSYYEVVKYLELLREKMPAHIAVQKLRMTRDSSVPNKLIVDMDLILFLLSA